MPPFSISQKTGIGCMKTLSLLSLFYFLFYTFSSSFPSLFTLFPRDLFILIVYIHTHTHTCLLFILHTLVNMFTHTHTCLHHTCLCLHSYLQTLHSGAHLFTCLFVWILAYCFLLAFFVCISRGCLFVSFVCLSRFCLLFASRGLVYTHRTLVYIVCISRGLFIFV